MKPDLRSVLQEKILVGDGAMGTYLYQMGLPVGISNEELNILHPEQIAGVHRQYYEAGARFIETNTFSANREKLSRFGLEREVTAINRAGVQLAREAVGADAYVIGSMGSIRSGRKKDITTEQVTRDFEEQVEALLAENVDGILLETFDDYQELLLALQIIRKISSISVVCQLTTEGGDITKDGISLIKAFSTLKQEGADVVGFNCRSGPNGIMKSLQSISGHIDLPFSIFPNAGIPDYVDGHYTYTATPEYFAESAIRFAQLGAKIIGGCCGTTPKHIEAIAQSIQQYSLDPSKFDTGPTTTEENRNKITVQEKDKQRQQDPSIPRHSILDDVKKRHTVIVELDPPRDLDIEKFMLGSKALKEAHVDALTMADNSLAVTRMSNLALGQLVKENLDVRPLIHIACRDRNLIGTQSHLMGLNALGIDHVLAVTGDPARFGDLPGSSSVYDMTSFEIIKMIKQLNEGISFSGKQLKKRANFIVGAAFNPNVKYFDKAIERLERKVESGADYIMTQPVYDPLLIEKIHASTQHLNIPIFIGIMPLASGRNAEYLHNEVPGIQLSDEVRAKMAGLQGEEGRRMGIEITKALLDTAMEYFHGIYLITPFLLYEMTVQLTQYVWGKSDRHDFHLSPF